MRKRESLWTRAHTLTITQIVIALNGYNTPGNNSFSAERRFGHTYLAYSLHGMKKKPLRITIINKKMNNKWTLRASSMICSMYLSLFSTPFVRPSFDFFVSSTLSVDLHQNYLQFYLIILQTHRLKFGLLSTTADRLSILHFKWTWWPRCGLK